MDKMLYLPAEQGDFLWAVVGEPLAWLVLWLVIINLAAFLFVLFCNRYYNAIYAFFGRYGFIFYTLFGNVLPSSLALFFLTKSKKQSKEVSHA